VRDGVDDVGFIDAVVAELLAGGDIDADRVYVTGMSNGAMMAYRLACELPGRFAAVGPVAGTMTIACTRGQPISVCHIHGLADQNVPFIGGIAARGFAKDARPSVATVIATWRTIDACGPVAARDDGSVHTETAHNANGQSVTLITVVGAGHQWPGSRPHAPRATRALGLDPPSGALDATTTLWQFFAAHPRTAATATGCA
jgi:polyhydroxybutyrate depolymerase